MLGGQVYPERGAAEAYEEVGIRAGHPCLSFHGCVPLVPASRTRSAVLLTVAPEVRSLIVIHAPANAILDLATEDLGVKGLGPFDVMRLDSDMVNPGVFAGDQLDAIPAGSRQ